MYMLICCSPNTLFNIYYYTASRNIANHSAPQSVYVQYFF